MANEMQKTTPFGMRDKVGYMFGDFANDFTFILSSSFLMKFYTDVMGVSAGVVGMIMMIARFVDAFTDVTMGQIVDRSKPTKDGKFRPWLKRMCGPVAIASFLIFQSGLAGMSYGFKVAWLFVTYILWGSIFYTSYYKRVVFIDRSPAGCYNNYRVLWIGLYHLPSNGFAEAPTTASLLKC